MLNSEIARRAGRAYVFTPFIWDAITSEPYVAVGEAGHFPSGNGVTQFRAAKIPIRAYMESPTSGDPWPAGDPAPRAVSEVWYNHMCPEENRYFINTAVVNEELGINLGTTDGIELVEKWSKYLRDLDAQCAHIEWSGPRIVDFE
jgi:hypothetical protein